MAHQIENMFSVGETPWHGLGVPLTEAPTVADAIKQAGLDWRVVECPLYVTADAHKVSGKPTLVRGSSETPRDVNSLMRDVATHKALIRATDGSLLGVVGDGYTPLQNAEAFDFFDPFVSSGLVTLETAGSLQGGKRVWVLARVTDKGSDIPIVGDDVIRKFILLSNSHDGTLAVRIGFTPVRVVCANTLAAAHQDGASALIRLRHSRSVVRSLDALRDVMNLANQTFEATADQYRALARADINAADLRAYVKTVLGHAATEDKDLSTRAENQVTEIISLFESGRGNALAGVRGTVWAAYNAVTEYLSHEASADGDKRYNSLWFGGNANRNALALAEAMKYAQAA